MLQKIIKHDYGLQSRQSRYRNPRTKIAAGQGFRHQHFIHFLNKMYTQFSFVPLFFYYSSYAHFAYITCVEGILNYTNAIRSHQICYDDCSYLFHIQYFFWQESENKIICIMDMNAFCCLYESEK
jgi:hypothetical protein